VQPQADAKGVRVSGELIGFENSYITADGIRFKQSLLNLLGNAVKYNRIGGEVMVSVRACEPNSLRIEVSDTGVGIAKRYQEQMFQPFNRLNAERTSIEGSGVGLVITKQLVELMQGSLGFYSEEGEGSRFWIDLPAASQWSDEAIIHCTDLVPYQTAQLYSERQLQLLYIEDNSTNLRLMEQIIGRYPQLQLSIADEAFLGVFKARSQVFDAIILDINLPGMNGFEVLEVLKQDPHTQSIPVIGLSANAMPYDIDKGLRAGFVEYLTKPVDIHRLIDTFNRLFSA
jgi:CheY-like chemotaxis protein